MYAGEVLLQKSPISSLLPAISSFYLNFLFQLQPENKLLVDQDLIFQSKQLLSWLKQIIWSVNFSSAIFAEQEKLIFFNFWLAPFCRWNQEAQLHFVSHAHALDVTRASASFRWMEIQLKAWEIFMTLAKFVHWP